MVWRCFHIPIMRDVFTYNVIFSKREIVNIFKQYGFTEAKRAWGSNGQSLGLPEEVDCYIPEIDLKIQSYQFVM